MKVSISVLKTIEELQGIRGIWEKWQWHPEADIDFYIRSAESSPTFVRPHVMVLVRNGRPSALLIGRIEDTPIDWKIGYKALNSCNARRLVIVYGGILGELSPDDCLALVQEATNNLARGEADLLFFDHIKSGSQIHRAAKEVPGFFCRDNFCFLNTHWNVAIPNTFDQYYQKRSRSTRRNMRALNKRLLDGFGENIQIKCFQDRSELSVAIRDIEAVASKTYQRGLKVGFYNTHEIRKTWEHAADRRWLRAYVLYLNKQPCAFNTGYLYKKTFYGCAKGYDPAYRYYNVGSYLTIKVIEKLCSEKIPSVMDFGFGYADFKKHYCDHHWQEVCVYLFAPSLKGLYLNALRTLTSLTNHAANNTLKRFNALKWVKRKWRNCLISR